MSKKSLVDVALSDEPVSEPVGEIVVSSENVRRTYTRVFRNGKLVVSDELGVCERLPVYPPNLTDQTHGLSIADQLHRGQGDGTDLDSAAYDFPDGRDDGREAISPFAYSEPADAWEAEQDFKSELSAQALEQARAAREQARAAREQADKAQRETIKQAQKTAQNDVSTSVDDKSSTSS